MTTPAELGGAVRQSPVDDASLPDVRGLVPHGPPFRFLSRVVHHASELTTCVLDVATCGEWLIGGKLPSLLVVEALAQAAAVRLALQGGQGPQQGWLVQVDEVTARRSARAAPEPLSLSVQQERAYGAFRRFRGRAEQEGHVVLEAVFTVAEAQ